MPALGNKHSTLATEWLKDGICILSFLIPEHSQNVITQQFLNELAAALAEIKVGPQPSGLVLMSRRAGSFFAGADLLRLEQLRQASSSEIVRACAAGRTLFGQLSDQPWPTVAVIDGVCLGGGLELALGCDLRIATTAAQTVLGFPEVKLGLLPGWGGTVRSARLIGPGPAVELIASGENIDGLAAERLGLVDACVPPEQALDSAQRLIAMQTVTRGYLQRRRQQAAAIDLDPQEQDFLEATSAAVILGRTGGHYPAPPLILATILKGAAVTAEQAGPIEGHAFATLVRSEIAGQLLRVFRIGERNRRDIGIGTPDGRAEDRPHPKAAPAVAHEVVRPAVIGAGIMGAGIAASHLRAGFAVTLIDVEPQALAKSVAEILDEAAWDRATKRTDPARALHLAGALQAATQMAAISNCDLVIESVLERSDVKRQVLASIEETVGARAVIATNTSTNPIGKLADSLSDPSRFCGMHFFNPVRRMTLVEIIYGPATSNATIATAVAHAKRLGKCPIVVRDSPGFLVNRLLMPYLHESVEMLREGLEPKRIDRIARAFGMPMGPLELYDMIGLDTAFYAGVVLNDAYGDRIAASPVIPALVRSGRLGRKSGAGFYHYNSEPGPLGGRRSRSERPDSGVAAIIEPYAMPARPSSDETIANRLFLPIVLEAILVLEEGIVRDGRDIDLAVIHALGFPAFRGGVLAWANAIGATEVLRRLEPLADLGVRMHPPQRLLELARRDEPFTV